MSLGLGRRMLNQACLALGLFSCVAGCASVAPPSGNRCAFTKDGIQREEFMRDLIAAANDALENDERLYLLLADGVRIVCPMPDAVAERMEHRGYRQVLEGDAEPWAVYDMDAVIDATKRANGIPAVH